MRKKIIHLSFAFLLVASFFSIRDSSVLAAKDDITGIKLEKEMRDLIEREIMAGYGEGEYLPGKDVTRGEFTALISRALKLPDGTPKFQDVKGSRIAAEIYQASSANIVNGYNENTFGINDLVTREQMAQIIDNALVYSKLDRKEATLSFTDVDKINQRFTMAVKRNVHDQIISGFPDGEFKPQKSATRAEAAAFISRMLTVLEKTPDVKEPPVNEEPKAPEEPKTRRTKIHIK